MTTPQHGTRATTARRAGLRPDDPTSLASIERRRLQVWIVMAMLLMAVSTVIALGAVFPELEDYAVVDPVTLRFAMVVLSASFTAYVFEKEFALRRLTRVVVGEREQRARLDAQVRRLHGLVQEAQALSAPLDVDRFLQTILACTIDLVDGTGAAMSLLHDGRLDLREVRGHGLASTVQTSSTAREATLTNRPVLSGARSLTGEHRSSLAVPIAHGGRVLGVVEVHAGVPLGVDSPAGASLVALADHVAVALSNATKYADAHAAVSDRRTTVWSELEAFNR